MFKDLLKGIEGITKSKLNIDIVEDNIITHRRQICNKCPYRDPVKDKCTLCGCKLQHKTRLIKCSCPQK
jgi:hypothetical protein